MKDENKLYVTISFEKAGFTTGNGFKISVTDDDGKEVAHEIEICESDS